MITTSYHDRDSRVKTQSRSDSFAETEAAGPPLERLSIDISSFFIADAVGRLKARAPGADVTFLQMNGADFRPDEPHSFSLASCIGASWIFGGHAGTLEALIGIVEPGGWVVVGEPHWQQEPSEDYLAASGDTRDGFGTHASNVEAGEQRGLELVYTFVSSHDDWDQYEGLQWYATAEYARRHPEDPDLPEIVERVAKGKAVYLRWGRETLGWAIYVFRRRVTDAADRAGVTVGQPVEGMK